MARGSTSARPRATTSSHVRATRPRELSLLEHVNRQRTLDNINVDADGSAWIAAHAKVLASACTSATRSRSRRPRCSASAPDARSAERLTEVYPNAGEKISAGSVGAVFNHRKLLIGLITERKILQCHPRADTQGPPESGHDAAAASTPPDAVHMAAIGTSSAVQRAIWWANRGSPVGSLRAAAGADLSLVKCRTEPRLRACLGLGRLRPAPADDLVVDLEGVILRPCQHLQPAAQRRRAACDRGFRACCNPQTQLFYDGPRRTCPSVG